MNTTYAPKHANRKVIDAAVEGYTYTATHRAPGEPATPEVKIAYYVRGCRGCTGTCRTGVGSDPCTCD